MLHHLLGHYYTFYHCTCYKSNLFESSFEFCLKFFKRFLQFEFEGVFCTLVLIIINSLSTISPSINSSITLSIANNRQVIKKVNTKQDNANNLALDLAWTVENLVTLQKANASYLKSLVSQIKNPSKKIRIMLENLELSSVKALEIIIEKVNNILSTTGKSTQAKWTISRLATTKRNAVQQERFLWKLKDLQLKRSV